ncbi:hypothetical protein BZA05DRAFT_163377 [Tricharina praecox]|uniref:uncharacterized protein n=1 Tax=Tricharina praecox TaxID=43433 RepID=UPI00221E3B76|nr:uncharacterized protein BZA05DRAFT_163377 [Tricharina praecox]KAI5856976.1 hypothetical protein BZA05DRAFT_163377 [Tricharina praecox]
MDLLRKKKNVSSPKTNRTRILKVPFAGALLVSTFTLDIRWLQIQEQTVFHQKKGKLKKKANRHNYLFAELICYVCSKASPHLCNFRLNPPKSTSRPHTLDPASAVSSVNDGVGILPCPVSQSVRSNGADVRRRQQRLQRGASITQLSQRHAAKKKRIASKKINR